MKWSELPSDAKRYIIYHVLVSPSLFTWVLLPYYLLVSGLSVLEVGMLYTVVEAAGIPLTLALGKAFTRLDVRKGLAITDFLAALSNLLYFAAEGAYAPLVFAVGMLVEEFSSTFYPLYQAYERAVYPQDRLKEVMVWHLRLPETAVVAAYPVMGVAWGYLCPSQDCLRIAFLFFAAYSAAMAVYILAFFKPVIPSKEGGEKEEESGLREALRSLKGKLRIYVAAYVLYILGWSLAPTFALVNYVQENYGGNLFHVALVESSVSLATVSATYLVDRIPEERSFEAMQYGVVVVTLGLALISLSPPFAAIVAAFYLARIGESVWFAFNRAWFLSSISEEESAVVSASISAIIRLTSILTPAIAGVLSYVDPRLPYAAGLAMILLTIPLYGKARAALKPEEQAGTAEKV